eukprot:CAMPEP_0204914088 /NCGR_PEP_ID=MMETSP1397-20131031/11918_1 /ASSEMBLY_ACC=CAM_ASM_000891 /TAXON_ID=49980 /ORGANISM="Climacostomum Climacostomum virens, Strain Stock W-24" /LENGTH=288 /DNA_ID=CAMNT_0052085491 /DNA_START=137 /DNA_END=1003 /DNA_ORIENTATION=-
MLRTASTKPSPEPVPLKLDEQIWENLLAKEKTIRVSECLAKHEIGPEHRAKMVSWMVEVLSELGSATQTLFLSIRYLDLYFKRHKATLPLTNLHIAGATAMFIASKYEDVYPVQMQIMHEEVVHKSFTPAQLKNSELKMLKTLDFDLEVPTCLDFLGYICDKLGVHRIVCHTAVNVIVLVQINYNGLRFTPSQQAVASLILAATSTRQLKLISQVLKLTSFAQSDLVPVLEWMHTTVTQFPKRYPKLKGPLECLRCIILGKPTGPLFKFIDEEVEAAHQALISLTPLA